MVTPDDPNGGHPPAPLVAVLSADPAAAAFAEALGARGLRAVVTADASHLIPLAREGMATLVVDGASLAARGGSPLHGVLRDERLAGVPLVLTTAPLAALDPDHVARRARGLAPPPDDGDPEP